MFTLKPIGHVSSPLVDREHTPKQGYEGAPEAWLVFKPEFQEGLRDLWAGEEILLLTWLDRGNRETLSVHPRDDRSAPLQGVFSTRSQDRPNPVGIHRVRIVEIASPTRFKVLDLEAFDATPVIDPRKVREQRRDFLFIQWQAQRLNLNYFDFFTVKILLAHSIIHSELFVR